MSAKWPSGASFFSAVCGNWVTLLNTKHVKTARSSVHWSCHESIMLLFGHRCLTVRVTAARLFASLKPRTRNCHVFAEVTTPAANTCNVSPTNYASWCTLLTSTAECPMCWLHNRWSWAVQTDGHFDIVVRFRTSVVQHLSHRSVSQHTQGTTSLHMSVENLLHLQIQIENPTHILIRLQLFLT